MDIFEWYLWGESLAKNGFTGTTSKTGLPNSYPQTGDTVTLRDFSGLTPHLLGGIVMGVTKTGGGRIKGDKSWSGVYSYFPSLGENERPSDKFNMIPPKPFQRGEAITGETDSVNVNEVTLMGALFSYGIPTHRYPSNIYDMLRDHGIQPSKIHTPQISITSAGAIISGSGEVTLETASQEDYWITKGKKYYILGFLPHLVNNQGFLQVTKGVPQDSGRMLHKDLIPFGGGAPVTTFRGTNMGLPYEPIGPFGMDEQPSLGLFSTAAIATTGMLVIAEM